jgi:hypothetical protein
MDAVMSRIVSHPKVRADCANTVRIKGKGYLVQPSIVSHEFVIGENAGTDEAVALCDIPVLVGKPFMLLKYGAKPVAGTVKFEGADNRFWLIPSDGNAYGGVDGHQIAPARGKFLDVIRPNLHEGRLTLKLKLTPLNDAEFAKKRARVRVLFYFIFFTELETQGKSGAEGQSIGAQGSNVVPAVGSADNAAADVAKEGSP